LQYLPKEIKNTIPEYETKRWIKSAISLAFIGGMQVIMAQTDIVMLKILKGPKWVGIYSVANRAATLVPFILVAVNQAFAPVVAELVASGRKEKLQKEVTYTARMVFAFSLPVALGFIFFGKFFLSLYGSEFIRGYTPLVILCLAQLVNAGAGSVGMLLAMAHYEREITIGIGVATVVNVFLNTLLIPKWGIEGAAVATGSSIIIWNFLLAWYVWKRLGIYSTVVGELRRL
jgi:O-antigen/teichoic acid export membrane protein